MDLTPNNTGSYTYRYMSAEEKVSKVIDQYLVDRDKLNKELLLQLREILEKKEEAGVYPRRVGSFESEALGEFHTHERTL